MKRISHFLWSCAGANTSILNRCPTEASKYAGVGATILFTGILAALASGYALFSVFENIYTSICFGLLWGLMIFNLDRYIISSMRKTAKKNEVLKMALPRIALALIIAIVISKPLELKMFEREINTELTSMQLQIMDTQQGEIQGKYQARINGTNSEIQHLKQEINVAKSHRDHLNDLARQEADGTGGSKKRNAGPIYQIKKQNADQADRELQQILITNNGLIDAKRNEIARIDSSMLAEIDNMEEVSYNGLAARLEALSNLKSKSAAIAIADWFIFLLFICMELSPIFVKLMSKIGPYDEILAAHEHMHSCHALQKIARTSAQTRSQNIMLDDPEKSFLKKGLTTHL
jgi:hypothetical protein